MTGGYRDAITCGNGGRGACFDWLAAANVCRSVSRRIRPTLELTRFDGQGRWLGLTLTSGALMYAVASYAAGLK